MIFCVDLRCQIHHITWLRNVNHKFYGKYQLYVDFNLDILENFVYELTERSDFFITISLFRFLPYVHSCYLINTITKQKITEINQITTLLKKIK